MKKNLKKCTTKKPEQSHATPGDLKGIHSLSLKVKEQASTQDSR